MVCTLALAAPGAFAQRPARETVVDVRVHGNHSIPDGEVLALAGVAVGDAVDEGVVAAITRRLEASGRFEAVEVRKRYRSLTATDRIALIIVVRERPRASIRNPWCGRSPGSPPSPCSCRSCATTRATGCRTARGSASWTRWAGGVGSRCRRPGVGTGAWQWTWSGRCPAAWSTAYEPVGPMEAGHIRISGSRIAARGPGSASIASCGTGFGRAWKRPGKEVGFVGPSERLTRLTVGVEYDGVSAGAFPRDDVKLRAAVERVAITGWSSSVVRPRIDAQAFKGVGGQAVLATRFLFEGASAALPPYEKALLGGGGSLRGWRVGARVGDRLAAASVELRLPLGSPIAMGNAGVRIFYDTAAAYDVGRSLSDQRLLKGAGGGVFLTVPFGSLHLDAGHDFRGSVRVHAGAGLGF